MELQLCIPYDSNDERARGRLVFIRHFATAGNACHRYIGSTDEGITETDADAAAYPECSFLAVSPMKRCIQTAELIYPDEKPHVYDGLRECDFGLFEGKNYKELMGDSALALAYQQWIDSGGEMPFPQGEDPAAFKDRVCAEFLRIVKDHDDVTFVAHGGTIMAVLERFAVPHKGFYDYNIKNGGIVTAAVIG